MMRHRLVLSAIAGAMLLSAVPAGAQYYDPYRSPPPPYGHDRAPPPYGYDRPPPPPYGYERPRYRRRFNDVCVTSRGECPTQPMPSGSPCGCYIPGFGNKRGAVP